MRRSRWVHLSIYISHTNEYIESNKSTEQRARTTKKQRNSYTHATVLCQSVMGTIQTSRRSNTDWPGVANKVRKSHRHTTPALKEWCMCERVYRDESKRAVLSQTYTHTQADTQRNTTHSHTFTVHTCGYVCRHGTLYEHERRATTPSSRLIQARTTVYDRPWWHTQPSPQKTRT